MNRYTRIFYLIVVLLISSLGMLDAQEVTGWQLDKMPADLETDFALSSLPPHLRDSASVYLLDPSKGYYLGRKGTNGFVAFVIRTEWERAEFAPDAYTAISFDPEGAKTYMPAYFLVAEMRASGKFSSQQVKDAVVERMRNGTYKAPDRPGLSYMLSPIHRTHLDGQGVVNQILPHYMFYAPRVDNSDIGGIWDGHTPFAISSGDFLDKEHSIFNYIIIPVGETEKAEIVEQNRELYQRMVAYKRFFEMPMQADPTREHQH